MYLPCLMFSPLLESVVWNLSWISESFLSLLLQIFLLLCSLTFPSGIPTFFVLCFFRLSYSYLTFSSTYFFHSFFSLYFILRSFYRHIFTYSSVMFILLVSWLKAFITSVIIVLIFSISFWLFLRFSISLLLLSICCLLFPLRPLTY